MHCRFDISGPKCVAGVITDQFSLFKIVSALMSGEFPEDLVKNLTKDDS